MQVASEMLVCWCASERALVQAAVTGRVGLWSGLSRAPGSGRGRLGPGRGGRRHRAGFPRSVGLSPPAPPSWPWGLSEHGFSKMGVGLLDSGSHGLMALPRGHRAVTGDTLSSQGGQELLQHLVGGGQECLTSHSAQGELAPGNRAEAGNPG